MPSQILPPALQPNARQGSRLPAEAQMPRRRRHLLAFLLALLAVAALALGIGALWLRGRLRASLPRLAGKLAVAGLHAPVTVERDALGVPSIHAADRLDAALALGFVHAQDRFFQMDLLRRVGAGELAELLGPGLVPVDRRHRLHRFRGVARQVVARSSPAEQALGEAYARGVNAGLAALGERPFEYLLLRLPPAPWKPEDSYLATYAMFFGLNDAEGLGESILGEIRARLPLPLFEFLAPVGTEWDAPLLGEPMRTPPVPGPEVFDLRQPGRAPWADAAGDSRSSARAAALRGPSRPAAAGVPGAWRPAAPDDQDELPGLGASNCWAVSGAHTADGRALLANDMHLGIWVPNTWYRAALFWQAADGTPRRVAGVSLPGTPGIAVGSNGHVAWGFTNSFADNTDVIELELDP